MLFTVFLFAIYFQWSCIIQQTDQCIETRNGNGLPSFANYGRGNGQIVRHHLAIIPSYEFFCCGNITEWRVNVHEAESKDQREYTLNLQVWRPCPTTGSASSGLGSFGSGYYNLVGNNRFTSVSLSDGVVEVTPSPRDHIPFQPGDVLGFYVEEAQDSNGGVVVITTASARSEIVWHASVSPQIGINSPISVGSNGGILNTQSRAAPIIEMEVRTYNCRQTAPTVLSCPSTRAIHTTALPASVASKSIFKVASSLLTIAETAAPQPTPIYISTSTAAKVPTTREQEDFIRTEYATEDSQTPTELEKESKLANTLFIPMLDSSLNGALSRGVSGQPGVVAGIVLAVLGLLMICLVLFISFLTVVVLSKKRTKNSPTPTSEQFQDASNAGHNNTISVDNPTYDGVDESRTPDNHTGGSEAMVMAIQNTGEECDLYQELEHVLVDHSIGPNTPSQVDTISVSDTHIYEADIDYQLSDGGQTNSSTGDTCKCQGPPLSEVAVAKYEIPEKLNLAVHTEEEREDWEIDGDGLSSANAMQ